MTANMPLLVMKEIDKRYGAVHAVRQATLTVDRGEIVAVVGENGAGKSTMMKILAGIEQPDTGQVLLDGAVEQVSSPAHAIELGISLVPQELALCLDLSVEENIMLGALPASRAGVVDRPALRAEAARRLAQLGLAGLDPRMTVRELGFVERAFVQIARGIRANTRVLIMDEPTSPMSQTEVDQLLNVLKALAAQGMAVLYISHRLEEVVQLAGRAIVMRDGAVVSEFGGSDLRMRSLVAAMLDEDTVVPRKVVARSVGDARLVVSHARGRTLKDASLQVGAGEIVAVYGVLGSGFEELGGAIVEGRVHPGGAVSINGTRLRGDIAAAIVAGLGYVPPERRAQGLHLGGSVGENLTLAMLRTVARGGVINGPKLNRVVEQWIAEFNIKTPSANTPVGALSGGSQQKVLVARWLAAGSTVLVLEEPTRGVDIATKREIYEALRTQAENGAAVLVISSDLEEVLEVADRVIIVRGGVIADDLRTFDRTRIAQAALRSDAETVA